ncbi:hypothetical protein ABMA57_01415 [Saccharospirillum sp. HFRX-1]|uniref:hypothetical protein n=1 Tax=unclassified Saccharospirillum TaxID=2633430 RepID=UPI0037106FA6
MNPLQVLLLRAAMEMGAELREMAVFVGGATVFLYIDDPDLEQLRATEDVDVIVEVASQLEWQQLERKVRQLGFESSLIEDDPICRFRKADIVLDIMPTLEDVLGFSNPWYPLAFAQAKSVALTPDLNIRIPPVAYFLATKLVAYEGRGKNDLMASKDMEDIFLVLAGRNSIQQEFETFPTDVKQSIKESLQKVQEHADFNYALAGNFPGSVARTQQVRARINNLIKLA